MIMEDQSSIATILGNSRYSTSSYSNKQIPLDRVYILSENPYVLVLYIPINFVLKS